VSRTGGSRSLVQAGDTCLTESGEHLGPSGSENSQQCPTLLCVYVYSGSTFQHNNELKASQKVKPGPSSSNFEQPTLTSHLTKSKKYGKMDHH